MWRAAAKNTDPPVLSPIEGLVLPMRLDPNGINYYDPSLGEPKFWSNGFQPGYLDSLIDRKQALIKSMYYIDWLSIPDKSRMTATEVNEHSTRSMRILGPMNSRMEAEFCTMLISRSIELGISSGQIPVPPKTLQGQNIAFEYTSPLAQAQRTANANNILQGLVMGAQLAQFDPTVAMNVNSGKIFRDQMVTNFNWKNDYLVPQEEVDAAKAQQQQTQQAAQEAALAESYSQTAKNGAGAFSDLQQE
jgi:hypothetical protein